MQYNILPGALWSVNTISGSKNINFNDLYLLSNYNNNPIFGLSSLETLNIDFDFGHRVHLDRFEYKYITNDAISSAVASGIKFFYKNESFDLYESSNTFVDDVNNTFYTTTCSSIFAPRYIRFSHTPANTLDTSTISGTVYGFKALNNDTIVDFGIDGYKTSESIETARGSAPNIKTIPIYNRGNTKVDALVNIEPTFSPIDDAVFISDNIGGPWIKALDVTQLIVDATNFSSGYSYNVHNTTGPIRISGVEDTDSNYISRVSEGYYITKIFNKNNTYCRFVLDNSGIGGNIKVDKDDVTETIEVRSSNNRPIPYTIFRELVNVAIPNSNSILCYRDRWLSTQSIKETSSWSFLSCSSYSIWKDYRVVFDPITERWVGYVTHTNNNSYSTAELYIFNNVGTTSSKTYRIAYQSTTGIPVNFVWRELKLDNTGGIWVYFYCQAYHTGDFVHSTGYFLAYFDVNLNNTFKWFSMTEDISKIDVDYNTRCVWYTKPGTSAIYRLDVIGDIQVNFVDEDTNYDLGGIAVLPDSSLIFANGKDLHRLKYNGIYLPEYFIKDVVDTRIDYIVLDGDGSDAIWTIEEMTVGRLYISGDKRGTYDFKVILDYPSRMIPVSGGVWVTCSAMDGLGGVVMRFISKENRRIDAEYRPNYVSSPGLLYQQCDHSNYVKKMPIAIDTTWSTLSWRKVSIQGFLTSEDQYYQLRIVLRRQEPVERYSGFISDASQSFFSDDSFAQTSNIPNRILWGNWLNYPNNDRVYVDSSTEKLVLTSDFGGTQNSFIETKDRMVVSRDANGILDIRLKYTFGSGDGVNSGKSEYLYLYAYSIEPGYYGHNIGAYIYIPSNSPSSANFVYVGVDESWTNWPNNGGWTTLNMYDGEIRLYWDGSNAYGQWRDPDGTFAGGQKSAAPGNIGNYFYIKVISSRNSSQVKIDDFDVYNGYTYYYTESPKIESIYKQELLEIKDVYPNNHKNVYVKTYVSKDMNIASDYDIDMKVRWRIPV
jgi:hypothetical protein